MVEERVRRRKGGPPALEAAGPEITSLGIGRVVAGQIIDLTVETSAGAVRIYCEVGVQGDTVILKDVAIYPANSETPLNVGVKEMRAALRPVLQKMKDAGFRRAVIQAYRISGATPGRVMNLTVTLK